LEVNKIIDKLKQLRIQGKCEKKFPQKERYVTTSDNIIVIFK